jgi:PAS domain-containing protein
VRPERQTGPEADDGTARLLLCGEVPADPDWFEGFETERVTPETVTERDAECVVAGDDWRPTVAGSAPVVVFLPSDTPAAPARDAGARRVVRRDDPEARALLVRAVESVVGRRNRSGSVESAAEDDAVDPPADVLLETVLDHAADSVSVVDSDGEIVYSSAGVERQLGDDPETLRGESFFEAVHPEDRTAVRPCDVPPSRRGRLLAVDRRVRPAVAGRHGRRTRRQPARRDQTGTPTARTP